MTSDITEDLASLRRRIDDIDDAIHDLLMRRSEVVERISAHKAGGTAAIRPAREAQILRRILARHTGPLAKPVVARIWREILAGATAVQGPFSVAAYAPEDQRRLWDICREHYGGHTLITATSDPVHAVRMVIEGTAQVAVVPWPDDRAPLPWWSSLVSENEMMPRIVARLPFVVSATGDDVRAIALAQVPVEPTGEDHSFLVLELRETISRSRLMETLSAGGLTPIACSTHPPTEDTAVSQHLVEVDGFVEANDPRIAAVCEALGDAVQRAVCLGSFAMPITVPATERPMGWVSVVTAPIEQEAT